MLHVCCHIGENLYLYLLLSICVCFLKLQCYQSPHITCCQKANRHISQEVKAIIDNCHSRPAVATIVVNIFVWTDIYMCSLWYNLFMQLSAQAFKPENAPVCVSRDCSEQWTIGGTMGFVQFSMRGCIALGAAPPPIIHVQTCSPCADKAL